MRLLGGVAVALLAPNRPQPLRRQIGDLDFLIDYGNGNKAERLLLSLGYQSDKPFNIAGRPERLRMLDEVNSRHVDLFVGKFRMCHQIPLTVSNSKAAQTIPAHELLLTKLQIVDQSPKDVTDVLALLHAQELTETSVTSIVTVCARDWGLWKTVLHSIDHCRSTLERSPLLIPSTANCSETGSRVSSRRSKRSPNRAHGSGEHESVPAAAGTSCPRR